MTERPADRVKAIREARGEDQEQFAATFNETARRLGLRVKLDKYKLSRTENGRDISLDEAVVFVELDPERRPMEWLARGTTKAAKRAEPRNVTPGQRRDRASGEGR